MVRYSAIHDGTGIIMYFKRLDVNLFLKDYIKRLAKIEQLLMAIGRHLNFTDFQCITIDISENVMGVKILLPLDFTVTDLIKLDLGDYLVEIHMTQEIVHNNWSEI